MSTNLSTSAARTDAVRTIGKGAVTTADAVASIVATLPDGFDYKARAAVTTAVHLWAAGGDADAARPAVTTGGKGEQTPTLYGTGVDTLTRAVKRHLSSATDDAESTPAVVNLLTRAGLKASREDVIAAWEAAQAANGTDTDADATDSE